LTTPATLYKRQFSYPFFEPQQNLNAFAPLIWSCSTFIRD